MILWSQKIQLKRVGFFCLKILCNKKTTTKSLLAISKTYLNIAYNYEYEKDQANIYYDGLTFQNKLYDEFTFENETDKHSAIEFLRTSIMHGWYRINDNGEIVFEYLDKDTRNPKPQHTVTAAEILALINEKLQKENASTPSKN